MKTWSQNKQFTISSKNLNIFFNKDSFYLFISNYCLWVIYNINMNHTKLPIKKNFHRNIRTQYTELSIVIHSILNNYFTFVSSTCYSFIKKNWITIRLSLKIINVCMYEQLQIKWNFIIIFIHCGVWRHHHLKTAFLLLCQINLSPCNILNSFINSIENQIKF